MFDAAEMDFLTSSFNEHLYDEAVIMVASDTVDSFGANVRTYVEGDTVSCIIKMNSGAETVDPKYTELVYDAVGLLPLGVTINERDQLYWITNHGLGLDEPILFEVVSPTVIGPMYSKVLLKQWKV